jgi:hypothetical protein
MPRLMPRQLQSSAAAASFLEPLKPLLPSYSLCSRCVLPIASAATASFLEPLQPQLPSYSLCSRCLLPRASAATASFLEPQQLLLPSYSLSSRCFRSSLRSEKLIKIPRKSVYAPCGPRATLPTGATRNAINPAARKPTKRRISSSLQGIQVYKIHTLTKATNCPLFHAPRFHARAHTLT